MPRCQRTEADSEGVHTRHSAPSAWFDWSARCQVGCVPTMNFQGSDGLCFLHHNAHQMRVWHVRKDIVRCDPEEIPGILRNTGDAFTDHSTYQGAWDRCSCLSPWPWTIPGITFLLQLLDAEVSAQLGTCETRMQTQIHNIPFSDLAKGIMNTVHRCCSQNSIQIRGSSPKTANWRGGAI